jgi:hypothetical protein
VKAAAARHVMPTVDPSMVLFNSHSSNRTLKKQWRRAANTQYRAVKFRKTQCVLLLTKPIAQREASGSHSWHVLP